MVEKKLNISKFLSVCVYMYMHVRVCVHVCMYVCMSYHI